MVRLIAKVSSEDEAKNSLVGLRARGVQAGQVGEYIILTLTEENGCIPNTGMHHAANAGEIQSFAKWANDANVSLRVGVHPAGMSRNAEESILLTQEMLRDIIHKPSSYVMTALIDLVGNLNAENESLRREVGENSYLKQKITNLEQQINNLNRRTRKLAHQRNTAVRRLRRVRKMLQP